MPVECHPGATDGRRSSTSCCPLRIMPYNTRGKRKQTVGEQVWDLMTQRYISGALLTTHFGSLVDEARFAATSQQLFTSFKARPRSGAEEHFIKMIVDTSIPLRQMVSNLERVLGAECEQVLINIAGRAFGPRIAGLDHPLLYLATLELYEKFGDLLLGTILRDWAVVIRWLELERVYIQRCTNA